MLYWHFRLTWPNSLHPHTPSYVPSGPPILLVALISIFEKLINSWAHAIFHLYGSPLILYQDDLLAYLRHWGSCTYSRRLHIISESNILFDNRLQMVMMLFKAWFHCCFIVHNIYKTWLIPYLHTILVDICLIFYETLCIMSSWHYMTIFYVY